MKRIPIYRGQRLHGWALVSDEDYAALVQWKWTMTASYPCRWDTETRAAVLMHREVMGCSRGDGREVDHVNGDGFDNRRQNLRLATRGQQRQNSRKRSGTSSRFRGVTRAPNGRWRAQGKIDGVVSPLGTYDDELEAGRVAAEWRREHHTHERKDESHALAAN